MGNQQSVEEGAGRRQPTKLTKPRTNTSTTNLLKEVSSSASRQGSKVELPMPPNRRASTLTMEPVEHEKQKNSKTETKQKRRSLFRSKTTQSLLQVQEVAKEKELDAWTGPLHRYSSMGTLSYEVLGDVHATKNIRPPIRATRSASVRPYSQQISRLSEIIEVRSPSPERYEGSKQLGEDQDMDDARSSTIPERSNSDHSMDIPIRRRSLQTPGIATRQSSRDDPYRKSLPSQISLESFQQLPQMPSSKPLPSQETPSLEEMRNYYYDSSKPAESPLEQLAALESRSLISLEPRTHTPNEMDYGHIGSFKLGSLRITNGACSPSPSKDEDYLTCSEGRPSVDNPYRKTYDPETLKNFVTDYGGVEAFSAQSKRAFAETRSESPLRYRQDAAPEKTITTTIVVPGRSLQFVNLNDAPALVNMKSPTRAYEIAQAYMQEIASSPFSFEDTPPSSPRLESTSKKTSTEDRLFEDEPDIDDFLGTKSSGPDVTSFADLAKVADCSRTPESRGRSKRPQVSREQNPTPLTKTDSGYNSNASLRSLKQRRHSNEGVPADMNAPGLPDKIPPPIPPKQQRVSYMSLPSQRNPSAEEAPPTPPKEFLTRNSHGLSSVHSPSSPTNFSQHYQNETSPPVRLPPPPPVPLKDLSTTGLVQSSVLPSKTPEQNWDEVQSKPMLVIPKATMPTYLRRQSMPVRIESEEISKPYVRPQKDAITVQGSSDVHNGGIPPIPQQAYKALNERVNQFPALLHSYKSVSRTDSKETLTTIFSMASAEQQAEELHHYDSLARVYQNLPPGQRRLERSRSRESVPGMFIRTTSRNVTPQISRRQSSDNISNRSSSRGRSLGPPSPTSFYESFEDQITSFNAVSNAIGASPYDVAISASGPSSRSNSRPRTPPSATPRQMKRNTIGMDSPAASQFARERSRQRSLSRRASWDRPVTQTPSLYGSSPPVPILPQSLVDDSPTAAKIKKTKSPPPVSLRVGPAKAKGPPPPAWASLSSAARDKMNSVCDSPPTSPAERSPRFGTISIIPSGSIDAEAEKQQDEQWEAQRRGWVLRRENAGMKKARRNSVEEEVAIVEGRIAAQTHLNSSLQRSLSGEKTSKRPQSFAPAPRSNTFTNGSTTTTTTTMETTYRGLKSRRSWDTSSAVSICGPSSTYSESVYSTTSISPQPRTLARTQSYGMLVDRSPPKIKTSTSYGPASSTTTTITSTAPKTLKYAPVDDYSNPHWRNLQRPPSNGTGYRSTQGQTQNQVPRWDEYTSYNGGQDSGYGNGYRDGTSYLGPVPMTADRYNGGFDYGFERGRGVQGSVGMRGAGSERATRKGVEFRGRYGVDLGDVPVVAYG